MSEHTPGPWRKTTGYIASSAVPHVVAVYVPPANTCMNWAAGAGTNEAEANGRRIVACVNACEGLNPEAVPDLLEAAYISADALEDNAYVSAYSPRTRAAVKTIRAAIAKATITPIEEA